MPSISISNMKFVYLRRFTLFSSWAYSVFLFYKKKVVPGLLQFLVLFCMKILFRPECHLRQIVQTLVSDVPMNIAVNRFFINVNVAMVIKILLTDRSNRIENNKLKI